MVCKMHDATILINFDDGATLGRSGRYWRRRCVGRCRQDLVPRGIRPSGMPMVPVLIHCRVIYIYIYLDAGASVSDAWVGTHADACNLTGRYIFAG